MCGASEKPMIMSGPAPEFEVTAVCWLMSSQPTKSTLTSTPVSLVNLAALARNTSSSACTNRTGRSMRKDAPFSIANFGAGTSAALMGDCADAPVAASAAAETPSASASRRVMSFFIIIVSLFFLLPALIADELAASGSQRNRRVLFSSWCAFPGADRSPLRPTTRSAVLAVGTAIHADRLPATKRGVLQHRRIDAAYRPHTGQYQ